VVALPGRCILGWQAGAPIHRAADAGALLAKHLTRCRLGKDSPNKGKVRSHGGYSKAETDGQRRHPPFSVGNEPIVCGGQ
jgi:hypothetical protein